MTYLIGAYLLSVLLATFQQALFIRQVYRKNIELVNDGKPLRLPMTTAFFLSRVFWTVVPILNCRYLITEGIPGVIDVIDSILQYRWINPKPTKKD